MVFATPLNVSTMFTVPVRAPVPVPVVTVTVNVTVCPNPDGFGVDFTVVVVEFTASAFPTSSMSSGEFGVTLVTSIFVSRGLAETVGAKIAPTTQSPETLMSGGPVMQVVVTGSTSAFTAGVIAVKSRTSFPSFSIVTGSAVDFASCRTAVLYCNAT